ncbi:hypothetical protein FRC10_010791 [Ceratobasidium sp. 414]|nr:hypothetical protein FRC10_010791 [Ceratobasidium sp. 414]
MPPRRSKKPAKESPSDSESGHEVPKPPIVSKVASKLKSVIVSESAAAGNKKRKRASSVERATEDEVATTSPTKKVPARKASVAKAKAGLQSPTKPPKRPLKIAAVPATKKNASSSESSEDELAVAPVSPVKPRVKGKAKATAKSTATASTPRKTATAKARKSTLTSAGKTRKPQDEYDSSMRELTHSSGSPTPSEDSDSRGSVDYDPKLDDSRNRGEYDLDESEAEVAALETMVVGSDALDDESDFGPHKIAERAASASPTKKGAKRESGRKSTGASASGPKGAGTTRGRKSVGKAVKKKDSRSEDEDVSDEDGPVIVGRIVKAPETGRVPPGQISQNTLDFLMNLQDPAKNDREWFKLHEPVFRLAEKEWVAFVEAWVAMLVEVDDEIPPLPPKDVIHRIYRDMRFSNDKTPYKRNFSASTSRSGRKGIFAGFQPGNKTVIAAGVWCPGKNEVQSIRQAHPRRCMDKNVIFRNHARRLRQIIAEPSFVKLFGPPKPLATKKGQESKRQSIFGGEDELKVAPTGVNKNHRDIDLLKCRSFAVVHRFTDAQLLREDFLEKTLRPVLEELQPFVHCLNDYMTIPLDDMSDASSSSSSSSSSDNE